MLRERQIARRSEMPGNALGIAAYAARVRGRGMTRGYVQASETLTAVAVESRATVVLGPADARAA